MALSRPLLRIARFTAWVAGIVAAIVGLLTWFYPASQSKEPGPFIAPPIQPPPVVIVQAPVVIVQAPNATSSIPATHYTPPPETPSPIVEVKEARVEPPPRVEVAVNAHPLVLPKPPLSESSLGLLNAAGVGNHDGVKQWIWSGADLNAVSDYGKTALMLAAENGHHDICRTLMANGARRDTTDQRGRNALHYAAERGHNDVVRLLLDHGVSGYAVDIAGKTPLDLARLGDHRTCVEAIRRFYR